MLEIKMNVIVCIKQVPETTQVPIDTKTGNLIREGVPSKINPQDKNAVEEALALSEKHGGKVTCITMGPPQAEDALREVLAMGVDEAILLSDKPFAGADTLATSYTLGQGIKKLGHFDVILCGTEAIDGNTAQVPPELAEFLGLPQVTYARKIDLDGDTLKAERVLEDGYYEVVETKLPVLVAVTEETNNPRVPALDAIKDAFEKEVITWTSDDIDVDKDRIGFHGSPTRINNVYTPDLRKGEVEMIDGSVSDVVELLLARLRERHFL